MGSFNVSCSLTNISISPGDRCIFFLVEQKSKYEDFIPTTIFYRGVYADYGNVEIDKGEKYQELLGDKKGRYHPDETIFVIESAFDALKNVSSSKYGDYVNKGTVFENGDLSASNLEKLGFILSPEFSKKKRFDRIYIHPLYPNDPVYSDGKFIDKSDCYSWTNFSKFYPKLDYSILKNIENEIDDLNRDYNHEYKEIKGFKKESDDDSIMEKMAKRIFGMGNWCSENMIDYLENADFLKRLAFIHRLKTFMYVNSISFKPKELKGTQCGNLQASENLHKIIGKVIKDKKKKNKEQELLYEQLLENE